MHKLHGFKKQLLRGLRKAHDIPLLCNRRKFDNILLSWLVIFPVDVLALEHSFFS